MNKLNAIQMLKEKREAWVGCFSEEDSNSIIQQLYIMIWDAAVFNIINEARRIAPKSERETLKMNGALHEFIDRSFFNSQFLAVRRLMDTYSLADPRKGVCSLRSLIVDIKENISLLSRENLFIVEGLEYDYGAIKEREHEYLVEHSKNAKAVWIPRELDSDRILNRHEQIDKLSGVNGVQRSPSDTISEDICNLLIEKLDQATDKILLYVKKYIAHAASRASREYHKADEIFLTLKNIGEAHKVLCQTANFVDTYILSRGGNSFLPLVYGDIFKYIEEPLVAKENIGVLQTAWNRFHEETDSWETWDIDELKQGINR